MAVELQLDAARILGTAEDLREFGSEERWKSQAHALGITDAQKWFGRIWAEVESAVPPALLAAQAESLREEW